jgi:hypothetical protein
MWPFGGSSNSESDSGLTKRLLFYWLLGAIAVGLIVIALHMPSRDLWSATYLIAFASLAAGAIVGFLFGVPRFKTEQTAAPDAHGARSASRYAPNTNLEQISDWLTKLFVGATLVELGRIPGLLVRFGDYFSPKGIDPNITVATGIYFSALGFFIAYLYAGLYLTDTLNAPSSLETRFYERAPVANQSTVETLSGASGENLIQARIALADSIPTAPAEPARAGDVAFAVKELKRLASQYEAIRAAMGPGDERTIKMEAIVSEMRLVANVAMPERNIFQSSVIAGERLACVVMLQSKPDRDLLNWLVDRFKLERPFVQYHAALALRSSVRGLPKDLLKVREAVETAMEMMGEASHVSDRYRVLLQTREEIVARIKP